MPTKTDRILSYLPRTFRALPKPTALHAVVDAFGHELLLAENSLAEVMRAHWVDHADRGSERIIDLALIAALYGLAPRSDEDVEEFREHLKRYIRTFLEGTVTVQGILRVTADNLGLRIADSYQEMDVWWNRDEEELITVEPCGADAADLIFGVKSAEVAGDSARAAQIAGNMDLSAGIDLRQDSFLRLKVDILGPFEINLANAAANPAAVTLDEIATAINGVPGLGGTVARHNGRYLTLASPMTGPASFLEALEGAHDAAERILGLVPRIYHGSEAVAARVAGMVDLSGKVDLSEERYLRLSIDGTHLAEIDCAGGNPSQTTLDEVRDAINSGLGMSVASHDGHFLTLTSPTTSFNSTIAFLRPAAQEASTRLFGAVEGFHVGRDAQPGRVTGKRDLSRGVNLSQRAQIELRIDGSAAVTIQCAGADPANTRPAEIVAAINTTVGNEVASHDGRFVTLSSLIAGSAGEIAFETPPESEDATEIIFGIGPRTFKGAAATIASIVGARDLSPGVDLMARHVLVMAADGGTPIAIDLRQGSSDPRAVTLVEMVDAINAALGSNVASHDGRHLVLASRTTGSAGRLAIKPYEITRRRRFVTAATVIDEAAQLVFGFIRREASGTAATSARVFGLVDLSRGVDLREVRHLRLAIDDRPALDIDCAGVRPRASTIDEVVAAINAKLNLNVASHDGRRLVLTSPAFGSKSRIAFEPVTASDALDKVMGVAPATFRGREATAVSFTGTVDLSAGVDLSAANSVKLGVDGAPPIDIACAGADPARTTLNEIVMNLNVALGAVIARHDGKHILLTSPSSGSSSRLEFAVPSGADATKVLFGIAPPRSYHGLEATKAQVVGIRDLSSSTDLRVARFMCLAVDGQSPVEVDCAASAADPQNTTLNEIVTAMDSALGPGVAAAEGVHLKLTSRTTGAAGRLDLLPFHGGDAFEKLFGNVPEEITGNDPSPAVITGEVDLLTPVDLSERRLLRLAVDGGRPVDIDLAGAAPESTFIDELAAAINSVFPGLASATEDDRLQLVSPTAGENSHLSLIPLRFLELIEYPPQAASTPIQLVRHGDSWPVLNDGAAEVFAEAVIRAPQGAVGPTLVNTTSALQVRLLTVLGAGETAHIWRDSKLGLRAVIDSDEGVSRFVPGANILVGPLGSQAWVPFAGFWRLSGNDNNPPALQLNNPLAPSIAVLRARWPNPEGHKIAVSVVECDLTAIQPSLAADADHPVRLFGRVRRVNESFVLMDANESILAYLSPGPEVDLAAHRDHVVAVSGLLHADQQPLMTVHDIAQLFDVTVNLEPEAGAPINERYTQVTIGSGLARVDSLVGQINIGAAGSQPSQLLKADEIDKGLVLKLPAGQSHWLYQDCHGSRFNQGYFNEAHFAGGLCYDRGVFNVSRFGNAPPEPVAAVFGSSSPSSDPAAEVVLRYVSHKPGAFVVNLPADLPARFGGRFNEARFGIKTDAPELFAGAVTEPDTDAKFLVTLVNAGSTLVKASKVSRVPIGWEAVEMPFRKPQFLTLGNEEAPARIYLAEEGLNGFIELQAREVGAWGNEISISARKAGPAMFDVAISYSGSRFENARQVVLGRPLETLTEEILAPGPIGVLEAKAAGVAAEVTRDRAGTSC